MVFVWVVEHVQYAHMLCLQTLFAKITMRLMLRKRCVNCLY